MRGDVTRAYGARDGAQQPRGGAPRGAAVRRKMLYAPRVMRHVEAVLMRRSAKSARDKSTRGAPAVIIFALLFFFIVIRRLPRPTPIFAYIAACSAMPRHFVNR